MKGAAYVRTSDILHGLRKFGPKPPGTGPLAIMIKCPACDKYFVDGDYTALIPLGPGCDIEAQVKCRDKQFYDAVAVEVHWQCATGEKP